MTVISLRVRLPDSVCETDWGECGGSPVGREPDRVGLWEGGLATAVKVELGDQLAEMLRVAECVAVRVLDTDPCLDHVQEGLRVPDTDWTWVDPVGVCDQWLSLGL